MPPCYRILEIIFYSILNFLPCTLLALYPFRGQLRFSGSATFLLVLLLTLIQVTLGTVAALSPEANKGGLTFLSTAVYFLLYFAAVKAAFGKMLFTLLMLSNAANLITMISKYVESRIFGNEMALQPYRWTYSVCTLFVSLIVSALLFWYFRRYYSDGIQKQAGAPSWNYLWLIPATFYLTWFWYMYGSEKTALEIALEASSSAFMLCINLGAFLVYHTVVRLINEQEQNIRLAAQNHQLTIQSLQYENLNRQIASTRQARHDLRQHIILMDSYLAAGQYDKLREYLQEYKKTLPGDKLILFCRHNAVNILLLYFKQRAEEKQIGFSVSASLPEQIPIPDSVLSVLFGNLLENALEACLAVQNRPAGISVKTSARPDALFLQIENTSDREPVMDADGHYLSSRHKGQGIGLESVQNIVRQYEGVLEINSENGTFRVSVLLNMGLQ